MSLNRLACLRPPAVPLVRRLAKLGAVTVAGSCPPQAHNCPGTTTLGITNQYLLGLGGEQVTELDGLGNRLHSNVYAGGKLLATYEPVAGLHFQFSDWLGTRRVQAWGFGQIEEACVSLPYGDNFNCSGPGTDVTEQHFTGKERDQESGLDYFGARYLGSNMGRWMSPDPSMMGTILELPQTWNKYSYMYNRPTYGTDPDGRCPPCIGAIVGGVVEGGFDLGKQLYMAVMSPE